MPNERIITPILGARFNPGHPQAQGLRHAWLLNEGAGRAVNDAVGGRAGVLVANPLWESRGAETGVALVSASSQYVDLGDVELLDGASKFTMIARMYRASSANDVELQKGTSQFARTAIQWRSNGSFFFTTAATADQWGAVTDTSTGVHTFGMVFDGTQATNATRLKGFYDGVPQTLTFTGTIPAATASTADSFRLGHAPHGARYSQGTVFYVFIYDRALSAEEIAAVTLDPYAPWGSNRPHIIAAVAASDIAVELPVADITLTADSLVTSLALELPAADVALTADDLIVANGLFVEIPEADIALQADDLLAVSGVECPPATITVAADALVTALGAAPTATYSDPLPIPTIATVDYGTLATEAGFDDSVSLLWTPVDNGTNPISTLQTWIDGVLQTTTTTTYGGGVKRGTIAPFLFEPGRTYTVLSRANMAGGQTEDYTWSFKVRSIAEGGYATGLTFVCVGGDGSGRIQSRVPDSGVVLGTGKLVMSPSLGGLDAAAAGKVILNVLADPDFAYFHSGLVRFAVSKEYETAGFWRTGVIGVLDEDLATLAVDVTNDADSDLAPISVAVAAELDTTFLQQTIAIGNYLDRGIPISEVVGTLMEDLAPLAVSARASMAWVLVLARLRNEEFDRWQGGGS